MDSIFDAASKIATPLGLTGLFGAVLCITLSRILQRHFIATVRARDSARILLRVINVLFILCLVGMILGFVGYMLLLRANTSGTAFKNSPQSNGEAIMDVKLLLRVRGFRINILNSGTVPATGIYVDVVSWQPGAPGPDSEKTIATRDLPPHADFTLDLDFLHFRTSNPEPDFTNTSPTCGYIAVSCIGASQPRAWAFYIPNVRANETERKLFRVDPWPIVEFQYPEDKPNIGSFVDYPFGVSRVSGNSNSPWLWNPKGSTRLSKDK